MECFTVRDGLSRENARFHEASKIIYLGLTVLFNGNDVKTDTYQHYMQNVLGKEDSRMDQRT